MTFCLLFVLFDEQQSLSVLEEAFAIATRWWVSIQDPPAVTCWGTKKKSFTETSNPRRSHVTPNREDIFPPNLVNLSLSARSFERTTSHGLWDHKVKILFCHIWIDPSYLMNVISMNTFASFHAPREPWNTTWSQMAHCLIDVVA